MRTHHGCLGPRIDEKGTGAGPVGGQAPHRVLLSSLLLPLSQNDEGERGRLGNKETEDDRMLSGSLFVRHTHEKNWRRGRWPITHSKVALLPCDHTTQGKGQPVSLCERADRPERFIWRAVICADHRRSVSFLGPTGAGGLEEKGLVRRREWGSVLTARVVSRCCACMLRIEFGTVLLHFVFHCDGTQYKFTSLYPIL